MKINFAKRTIITDEDDKYKNRPEQSYDLRLLDAQPHSKITDCPDLSICSVFSISALQIHARFDSQTFSLPTSSDNRTAYKLTVPGIKL